MQEGVENLFSCISILHVVAIFELASWLNVENGRQCQRLCNCVNNQILEGYPGVEGEMEKGLWMFFDRAQPYTYVVAIKYELARCLVEKVEQGQRLCNCVNSQFLGLPRGGRDKWEGGWEYIFVDLNPIPMLWAWLNLNSPQVTCGKSWTASKILCNCVNSQIFEGYSGMGGTDGEGVVNIFDRAQPYLCCDQIWTRQMSCGNVEQGQRLCNFVNSQIFEATHRPGKGRVEEGGLSIFLIALNPIYVLVKLQLGAYANWLVIVNFKCISIVQVVPLM